MNGTTFFFFFLRGKSFRASESNVLKFSTFLYVLDIPNFVFMKIIYV